MITTEMSFVERARRVVPPDVVVESARGVLRSQSENVFGDVETLNPVRLYGVDSGFFYLPLALAIFYGDEAADSLHELGTTIAIGHGHFAIMDRVLDARSIVVPLIPAAQIMLSCYLSRMERAFGAHLDVRAVHDVSYVPYAEAALVEHAQRGTLRSQDGADLSLLGSKSAPACMPLRAILTRVGQDEICADVERAFLTFAGALQMLDDLADLRADFADRLSSVPLNLLFFHAMGLTSWPSETEILPDDVPALALLGGVRRACLRLAASMLADTLEQARGLGVTPLSQAAEARLTMTEREMDRCGEATFRLS